MNKTLIPITLVLLLGGEVATAQPPLPEGLQNNEQQEASSNPQEPALPEGLGGNGTDSSPEPALPAGLGGGESQPADSGPALPEGLGGGTPSSATPETEPQPEDDPFGGVLSDWRFTGFWDNRAGVRFVDPIDQETFQLAESRLQIKALRSWDNVTTTITADFIGDAVAEQHDPDLNTGDGFIDLREANVLWRAAPWLDIKAGRQILTWGTGDFIFLNDLFPKDYQSFFIGRRDVYLKAPSDAIKASFFSDIANLDIVYTPQFDSDRFAHGSRLHVYNPFLGRMTGDSQPLNVVKPNGVFDDDEWAGRLYRTFGAYELAFYAYDGFWKSPNGLLPAQQSLTFNELSAYGASVRGPAAGGIGNVEVSYYDSSDDADGDNPNIPNSQFRTLVGYERELIPNLTGSIQYNTEFIFDHDDLLRTQPAGAPTPDELRHLLAFKLVRSWPEEQITATFFTFYSPSDEEVYIRPRLKWDITDQLTLESGINWMFGTPQTTQFAQFEEDSNAFFAVRYGF